MSGPAQNIHNIYDPLWEHDACGIGAVVNLKGTPSHATVDSALKIVEKLEHRAGKDAAGETGDGVGLMIQVPHKLMVKTASAEGIAPVLVISSPGNLELCGDRNLIKLAVPSSRAEFFASLDLAQGVLAGGAPAPRLHIQRSAEEERLICRAKAVLMEVNLMSEAEAHRFLQKYSMDTGLRLAETARLILERYTTG